MENARPRPGADRVDALEVIPLGLEPKTHSLEGCCSIQLSYGTKADCKDSNFLSIYSYGFSK